MRFDTNIAINCAFEQKTTAHRRFVDDVPQDVKNRRVSEMAKLYRAGAEQLNAACVGTKQIILIEGVSIIIVRISTVC